MWVAEVLGQVLLSWWGHGSSLVGKAELVQNMRIPKILKQPEQNQRATCFLGVFWEGSLWLRVMYARVGGEYNLTTIILFK